MPCTSDPEWEAPLDAEIEKDSAHVARIGDHAGAAERLRQEIDDQEAESRAQAMLDAHAALLDEAPTLKYFVVWGGPYEGVHGIFDAATELQPLIEMPGARAYGAADGVESDEKQPFKLRKVLPTGEISPEASDSESESDDD